MSVKINIENQNKKRKIDLLKVKSFAETAAHALKKDNIEANIVFLTSQKIRVLNRVYLGRNTATDVIAFSLKNGSGREGVWTERDVRKSGREYLGDIAISSDRAARNAAYYGVTFEDEIARCVIHGILHLAGYRDTTRARRAAMKKKENEILQKAGKSL